MASRTVFRFLILLTALVWIMDAENVTRKRRDPWTNGSWFSLGFHDFEKWVSPPDLYTDKSRMCTKLRGLTPGQRRMCRRNKDHMPVISAGVKQGIVECQHQFKDRRWNCTTTDDDTVFGPLTLIGSRETAFTHAVTSAGVSLSVSRACRDGRLASCGCGRTHRPPGLRAQWRWAGCGDDLHYSYTHGDLSKAQPGVQGRVRSDRLWQQLAGQLNSVKNGGVVKSVDKWKKVWADWKTKTKKKYLNYQHARAAGRPTPGRQQMTGLEDRVVAILSASANQGIQDLGIVYSNNDDSNNEVPQYGMGEVEVHISNITLKIVRCLVHLGVDYMVNRKISSDAATCIITVKLHFGFTEEFVDIRERERKVKRGSSEQGRQLMNRHNNEAGRRAVIKKSRVTCKCHGVSGSCSLVTCWQQLPSFREIGDSLKDKYDSATEVKVSRRGRLQLGDPHHTLPTAQDLVYLEESPNYCVRNDTLGSLGTSGRECNRTSAGMDGCSLMCCGRGYNTKKEVLKERCGCKFHWCCRVECNTCVRTVELFTCK